MQKPEISPLMAKLTAMVIASGIGWTIGACAWGMDHSPALAAILPLAIGLARTRTQAYAIGLFYILGVLRGLPSFAASWFDNNLLIGTLSWISYGVVGGAVWSLGWTGSGKPLRKALASALGWIITLVPPAAAVVPGHPVIAWGFITPGWGWIGVLLSILVPAALLWFIAEKRWPLRNVLASVSMLSLVSAGASFAYTPAETRYVNDVVAVSTKWGTAKDPFEILNRIERMGRTVKALSQENLASVVIFPESIVQKYEPAIFPVLNIEILKDAGRAGQTVVLGADLPTADGNFQTAAIAFFPDGRSATALARQTVPVALWKPWASAGSFESNWRANNILPLRDGLKARILFCYEEYIPVLSLLNEALDDHQMVVVMSNTWASQDQLAPAIQSRHSEGIARLFGRKLIKAENRPKEQTTSK